MKLRNERIELLSQLVVQVIRKEGLAAISNEKEPAIISLVHKTIYDDLEVEDKLDEEVREILQEHADQIDKERIPYHQMFKMVKEKLIRDRNLIL